MKPRKILLISHEMSYTGAPIALFKMAKVLVKNNYNISVASLKKGQFSQEYEKINIKVNILDGKNLAQYKSYFKEFDLIIVNSIVSYKVYKFARKYVPTIFFITEAEQWIQYCNEKHLGTLLKTSKTSYCVSEYAAEVFKKEFNANFTVLHNATEDFYENRKNYYKDDKLNIAIIGTIYPLKSFHTVINSIKTLPLEYQQKICVRLAGEIHNGYKDYCENLMQDINKMSCIEYIGAITDLQSKNQLYKDTDIVIVPSIDESCSLVALEAAMMACALVMTHNVGAKYLINRNSGFLFEKENVNELSEIIKKIIDDNVDIAQMGICAREEYLKTSTIEIYEKNILDMVNKNYIKLRRIELFLYRFEKVKDWIFSCYNCNNHIVYNVLGFKIKIREDK